MFNIFDTPAEEPFISLSEITFSASSIIKMEFLCSIKNGIIEGSDKDSAMEGGMNKISFSFINLVRKGRLICEHKFTPLSVENSNKLLKHLGKTKTVDKPTSLADIYHIDEDLARVENKIQIGFKNN